MFIRRCMHIIGVLGLIGLWIMTAPGAGASEIENCAAFDTHQEAVAWFEANGGSARNNAGNLDADRDGIPCEHLLNLAQSNDEFPVWLAISGGAVVVAAAATVGGGWVILKRRNRTPVPVAEPVVESGAFRPIVPMAKPVADTGMLQVTVSAASEVEKPEQIHLDIDGEITLHDWLAGSGALEILRDVPAGDRMISIGTAARPLMVVELVTVIRDDVTRLALAWPSATTAPNSSDGRTEPDVHKPI